MYRKLANGYVRFGEDLIPPDPDNSDYRAFLVWVEAGNAPDEESRPVPTLKEAKKQAHLAVKTYATNLRDRFIAPLSAGEAASWLRKEEEATRFQIDGVESNALFLRAEALVRGVTVADLAAKVLENAASLKYLEAQIAGNRGRHDDAIDQLITVEAVLAYDWSTGWVSAS